MSVVTKAGLLERLEQGPVDLRGGLPVRMRAAWLPAGRRVRPGGGARASRGGRGAAPRVRPRRLGRRRGLHLLRPPREAAADRQGAPARAAEPRRARARRARWRARPTRCWPATSRNTNVYAPDDERAPDGARDVRRAGGVGGRGRRGLPDRRDVQLARGGADRARGHARDRAADGRHARPSTTTPTCARALARSRRAAARGGRRRRRRPQLLARARHDAAAARADPRGGRLPRRGAAGAVPHDRRAAARCSRCATRDGGDVRPFPTALDPFTCTRGEMGDFARDAHAMGVGYLGVCCGAGPHHVRALAEALGRTPGASRYSPDMSKHAYFGTDPSLRARNQAYAERL